jgi:uncharacterized protein YecE (DUF72 family)
MAEGKVRIGVSGWRYRSWRGDYYPRGLTQRRELEHLSRRLDAVEVNGSFYSLQRASSYLAWRAQTPATFRFALKGSRFITHNLKLANAEQALANFFASGPLALGPKLGPIVWQLPERQRFDAARLGAFCALLPRTFSDARELALAHDARVRDPWTEIDVDRRIGHALEARNESFFCDEAVRVLRAHRVALVVSDAPGWRLVEELTADFVYIRFHGASELYHSRYSDAELDEWSARIGAWRRGSEPPDARRITAGAAQRRRARPVWAFFDNDARGHAPWDAERLRARLAR